MVDPNDIAAKRALRAEADARLRELSQEAMHAEHDAFGMEQINEKIAAVKTEIEQLDNEIAELE
jgi:hypothetical protein